MLFDKIMLYDEQGRAYVERPIIPEEQHLMYIVKDYRRMYNMHKKMQAYIQKSDEVIKRSANRNYALIRINREQRDVIIRCIKWMKKKDINLPPFLDNYAKENRL
jgi:hypothetical protein